MLIDKGAQLNAVDDTGNSALHYAAENGELYFKNTTSTLLDYFLNQLIYHEHHSNIWNFSRSFSANLFKGFLKIVRMLVKSGAKLDIVNKRGSSVVDAASHATQGNLNTIFIQMIKKTQNEKF